MTIAQRINNWIYGENSREANRFHHGIIKKQNARNVEAFGRMTKHWRLDMNSITKKCSKCGEYKTIDKFKKDKNRRDGVGSWCLSCHCIYGKNKSKERSARYYKENKHSVIARVREYAKINHQKVLDKAKEWGRIHPDRVRETHKRWKIANPGKLLEAQRVRRALKNGSNGVITDREWNELVEKYKHTCLRCKRNDVLLTLDHVVPLSLGGSHSIDNAQPLCHSCNSIKHTKTTDYR